MTKPILTVVMPIYNGERHVRDAIESVLNQTFADFELIIINDGSTDGSLEVVSSFVDKRIRILNNNRNRGIPYSRNRGLKEANGEFLCWTDCDDLNYSQRFEKQIFFLQNNPDYGGCGTWLARFKDAQTYFVVKSLEDWKRINASLIFRPATIPNPTVMLRLSEIRKYNIEYNPELAIGEDYDFIFSCTKKFKFTNIQEVLYKYRDSETSIMKQYEAKEKRTFEITKLIYKRILSELDIQATETEFYLHHLVCSDKIFDEYANYTACHAWMKKINKANDSKKIYDAKALRKVMADQSFFVAKKASKFGLKTLNFYLKNARENNWSVNFGYFSKLTARCLLKYDKFEFKLP